MKKAQIIRVWRGPSDYLMFWRENSKTFNYSRVARAGLAVGKNFAFWRENSKTLNCSRGQGRAGLGEYFAFWRENKKNAQLFTWPGPGWPWARISRFGGKMKKTLNYSRVARAKRIFNVLAGK